MSELLEVAPKEMTRVKSRIVDGYLVLTDVIDMQQDWDIPINDYFDGISPVVLAMPKKNYEHLNDLCFFPIHHFASDQLHLVKVDTYYRSTINADGMLEKYGNEEQVVYVLTSSPQKKHRAIG